MSSSLEPQKVELELKNAISRVVHVHRLPPTVDVIVQGPESGRMYLGTFRINYFGPGRGDGAFIDPLGYFMLKEPMTMEQMLARYKSDSPLIFGDALAAQLGEKLVRLEGGYCQAEISGRHIDIYIPDENLPVFSSRLQSGRNSVA